jgi:hypothetical protein
MRLSKDLLPLNTVAVAMRSPRSDEPVFNYGQHGSLEKAKMTKIPHLIRNESSLKIL